MSKQLEPPRPLSAGARAVWDRSAQRLFREGRWAGIDQELLAVFSETMALYLRFRDDVARLGTLVPGRRDGEVIRNPSLISMAQCRADLVRLARQIPLVVPATQVDGFRAEVDLLLEELR
jgi:phage terminase small subunit